jgi:hypothetical protein
LINTNTIRFDECIPQNYELCGENNWKRRYPKDSEEMKKCYSTYELYVLFSKN